MLLSKSLEKTTSLRSGKDKMVSLLAFLSSLNQALIPLDLTRMIMGLLGDKLFGHQLVLYPILNCIFILAYVLVLFVKHFTF